MRRLFTIDLKDYQEDFKIYRRPSVRAIICNGNKLRLVYSPVEKYYKFPGGGIRGNEDRIDTLIREVREETGLVVIPETVREYGSVLRRQNSDRDEDTIFEQENFYYFCDVSEANIGQDLDSYEEKLEFTLRDVDIDEAIRVNDEYTSENAFNYQMIKRELRVLQMLKEEFFTVGTKTTVIFVRHAQSLHPWEDDRTRPLTEEGMLDRAVVLDTIKGRQIDAFFSSPYRRSVDTIQAAADYFSMSIITDERFCERKSGEYGNGMGQFSKRWTNFDYAEQGGESLRSTQERNVNALFDILDKFNGKTIVIGTHGTALSTILNYYDPAFDVDDFLRIIDWMPYIVELSFIGRELIEKRELAHIYKEYQKC